MASYFGGVAAVGLLIASSDMLESDGICVESVGRVNTYMVEGTSVVPWSDVLFVLNALSSDQLCWAMRVRSVAAGTWTSQYLRNTNSKFV